MFKASQQVEQFGQFVLGIAAPRPQNHLLQRCCWAEPHQFAAGFPAGATRRFRLFQCKNLYFIIFSSKNRAAERITLRHFRFVIRTADCPSAHRPAPPRIAVRHTEKSGVGYCAAEWAADSRSSAAVPVRRCHVRCGYCAAWFCATGVPTFLRFLVQKRCPNRQLVSRVLFAVYWSVPRAAAGFRIPRTYVLPRFRLVAEHGAVEKVRVRIAVTLEIAVLPDG